MAEDTAIERHIKTFVSNKTGESVYLDLSKSTCVTVKHKLKRGSTSLASLWVRMLQHVNNYPVQRYPYRELYEAKGSGKVILKVDDVAITVFLSTGTLMIQGNFVLEWFMKRFEDILNNYDAPEGPPQPTLAMYKQYGKEWNGLLEKDKAAEDAAKQKDWDKEEAALRSAEELPVRVNGTDDDLPVQVNGTTEELPVQVNGTAEELPVRVTAEEEEEDKEGGKLSREEEGLINCLDSLRLDQLMDEDLDSQLEKLRQGSVEDGPTVVYPLWKALLDRWFSNHGNKVYLATPFLDTERLSDICQLVLKNKFTANLEALYVRQNCDHKLRISDLKRNAQNQLEPKDQLFIEYKVYNRIIYPLKRFHAKFLACVNKGKAHVLVTSANFHADHFHFPNLESVVYLTMPEAEFIHRFLRTIQASQLEVKTHA